MNGKVQGWDELQKQLKAIADADYTPAMEKGVREAILPEMKANTPVDTGDLVDSEDVVRENDTVSLVAGNSQVGYALYVEMGTASQAAQPFMRPALDAKSDAAMKIAAKEAEAIMKKAI